MYNCEKCCVVVETSLGRWSLQATTTTIQTMLLVAKILLKQQSKSNKNTKTTIILIAANMLQQQRTTIKMLATLPLDRHGAKSVMIAICNNSNKAES